MLQLARALVLIVAQLNGHHLWMMVAHHVVMAVQHVPMAKPVLLVLPDMKAIMLEDAEYAMKEHILQLAILVFLVPLVNGPLLEAIFVKTALKLMDVSLAPRLLLVILVLLDIRPMDLEAVVHAVLDTTLHQMVPLVSSVLVENIQMSHQALVHLVTVMVLVVALVLQ